MLEGIALYLHAEGIVRFDPSGVSGDAFIEHLPDQPRDAVALMSTGGPEEPSVLHPFDTRTFQVLVRGGADPRPPKARTWAIYGALQGLSNTELPDGTWVVGIGAIQAGPDRKSTRLNSSHVKSSYAV